MPQTRTTDHQPIIAILGCGYVGLTTAALFAASGCKVYALEINQQRLTTIKAGKSFFYEEGIEPLLAHGIATGNIIPSDSYHQAIPSADFIFSCVGTPDNADGSANLSYVFEAAESAGKLMKHTAVYVQKSTVPVGTGRAVEAQLRLLNATARYVSNPEFLREGTAIADALWPDRTVVGSDDPEAAEAVLGLYRQLAAQRQVVAKLCGLQHGTTASTEPAYITTSLASAELIKVSANAFLALKISFANSIAKLADQAGADIREVMDVVGADNRIGRSFLNAGRGYGGGCFPKDVSGLIRSAEDHGVEMEIMRAVEEVNQSMPHYIINKAETALGASLADKRIAVLGIAFKSGTSDVRRSPGIAIANTLANMGAQVSVYDPEAIGETAELQTDITRVDSLQTATAQAEVVFVATDWPEFKDARLLSRLAQKNSWHLLVDCMNCLDGPSGTWPAKMRYIGVGH